MVTGNRPGTLVTSRADTPPRGNVSNSGTWFVVGAAEKGPTTYAKLIRSMQEFKTHFGNRVSSSVLSDSLETAFKEGLQQAYVARVVGASSAIASVTLSDGSAGNSLTVSAKNAGLWGNGLSVQVTQPQTGYRQILVISGGVTIDQSPLFATQSEAVSWSRKSDFVNVTIPNGGSTLLPAVAAAASLTGGLDDYAGINDTLRQSALSLFTSDMGSGQVSIPGNTTGANRTALKDHAAAFNRQALLDGTDTSSRSSAVSEASALQGLGNEYSALFLPWCVIPGLIAGQTRTVPPTALVAGLMARSDSVQSVNVPALGNNGFARFVIDVTQPAWTDFDRNELNEAGVNVIRTLSNRGVDLYGYRTLANPKLDASWLNLGNQRLREQISQQASAIAASFVGAQLDGKGRTISEFVGRLTAMLQRHYQDGALYGDTPEQAFQVDAGPSINTIDTLASNELHAVISLKMSPFAELVVVEVVKVALAQAA